MKAGNSLKCETRYQIKIAIRLESSINQLPYRLTHFIDFLICVFLFRLISIYLYFKKKTCKQINSFRALKKFPKTIVSGANQHIYVLAFFYPDFTVDSGISPDHARFVRVGFTTDRELEVSFLTLPRRRIIHL